MLIEREICHANVVQSDIVVGVQRQGLFVSAKRLGIIARVISLVTFIIEGIYFSLGGNLSRRWFRLWWQTRPGLRHWRFVAGHLDSRRRPARRTVLGD